MPDPMQEQRRRELELRREQELKDLETEGTPGPRPLEGLSEAHTTWTGEQDDRQRAVHGHDEEASRRASEAQVPRLPDEDAPPQLGEDAGDLGEPSE